MRNYTIVCQVSNCAFGQATPPSLKALMNRHRSLAASNSTCEGLFICWITSKVCRLICLNVSLIFSRDSDARSRGYVGMNPVLLIILAPGFNPLMDFLRVALSADAF